MVLPSAFLARPGSGSSCRHRPGPACSRACACGAADVRQPPPFCRSAARSSRSRSGLLSQLPRSPGRVLPSWGVPEIVGGLDVHRLRLAGGSAGAGEAARPRRPPPPHRLRRPRRGDPALSVCRAHLVIPFRLCMTPSLRSFPAERPLKRLFPRTLTKPVHTANLRAVDLARRTLELDRHPLGEPARRPRSLEHVADVVPLPLVYGDRRGAPLRDGAHRQRRSCCSRATSTPFPPRTTCPGGSRTAGWSASARAT